MSETKTTAKTAGFHQPGDAHRFALAAAIPLAAFALQWCFWAAIQPYVWFLFFPAVFFSSWIGGLRGGLVATVLSTGLVWFFFIPPQLSFAIERPMCMFSIAMFMFMGILFSLVHDRLRKAHQQTAVALQAAQTANVQLQAANNELDAFTYAITHDLRAPLRAMSGFSQALAEDHGPALKGEAHEYLNEIILASRHMGELIDGLLRLSRSTRGELRHDAVNLSDLATRILGGLAKAEPQRQATWTVEPGLVAQGDARMIELVLANLLGNAWKYTARTPQPAIRFCAARHNGSGQMLCVADNGAGFDMKHAARLFQPFQRLHREDEFPGIGIGLATVQRIVQRHGGTIRATATPGEGATFCFNLPGQGANKNERT